jgi:hypothetical protein
MTVLLANSPRRVRCDRTHPCQNCTRRGQAGICTFIDSPVRKRAAGQSSSSSDARSMRQRITQLESMVRSFIEPRDNLQPSSNHSETPYSQNANVATSVLAQPDSINRQYNDIDIDEDTALDESNPSPGQFTSATSQTSYVGSAHWDAVLSEVSRVYACCPSKLHQPPFVS